MNRIARSTRVLELLSILGAIMLIGVHAALWLTGYSIDAVSFSTEHIASMPLNHRLLGLLVDSAMLVLIVSGVITFVHILRRLRAGEFFSAPVITLLNRLSMLALAWAIFNPIRYMLLSVITSWHLGTGNRVLSLAIGSSDIVNIIIFASFVLITALMQEGNALQQERDLTI